ncbi:hypothetical protein [Bacillus sp. FJAT-26390]|uniref:hypothetical protein n=1 Tax=Bacillus sp. FJAT-26390 TaxID=1743142 RepID=UPI000807C0D1|nr:hypothetical protein [Bacillus sp. FJAT-26390]OBZ17108.1 hypothetical protein A7975_04260 [Bacillus sp. FJAT-26390]
MRTIEIDGIEFELQSWDFRSDGGLGVIKFLVPKGTFQYDGQNGAYCWNYEGDDQYDVVGASCHCFQVNGHSEDEFMRFSLWDVAYAAAKFITTLPKTEAYNSKLEYQKYADDDADEVFRNRATVSIEVIYR